VKSNPSYPFIPVFKSHNYFTNLLHKLHPLISSIKFTKQKNQSTSAQKTQPDPSPPSLLSFCYSTPKRIQPIYKPFIFAFFLLSCNEPTPSAIIFFLISHPLPALHNHANNTNHYPSPNFLLLLANHDHSSSLLRLHHQILSLIKFRPVPAQARTVSSELDQFPIIFDLSSRWPQLQQW